MFVQNWNAYINDFTCARCYILYANFRFQPYLNLIHIEKREREKERERERERESENR